MSAALDRNQLLAKFATQIAAWIAASPGRAGEIRGRICARMKLREDEFDAWIGPGKREISPEQQTTKAKTNSEEISRDDAETWIAEQFEERFTLVKREEGLARDKAMSLLFRDMAKYLFAASAITSDRIRSMVCKEETKGGIGLGKRAYDAELRKARAEQCVEHGDSADYLRFARMFLNEIAPERAVLRWREEWLLWERSRGAYQIIKKEAMDSMAVYWLNEKGVPIEERGVRDFLFAVRALVVINDEIEPPYWINSRTPYLPFEFTDERRKDGVYVAMRNGVLDIDSAEWLQGDEFQVRPMIPHTPDFFCLNALPYEFDPNAECPQFLAALEKWQPPMERDVEHLRIRALQDFAGYLFWPGQGLKTFMLCIGPGDDGKSQIMKIYEALAGLPNCAAVDLSSFDPKESFGRAPLLGKTFATVPDASKVERLAVGIIKAITGGDRIGVNRKGKSVLDTPIAAKIMVTANQVPGLNDDSEAIWNRLLILYFNSIPVGERELGFAERLIREEISGIFLWALAGYRRLRLTGSFKKSGVLLANLADAKDRIQHERKYFQESIDWYFDGPACGCKCVNCAGKQTTNQGDKNAGILYSHKLVEQYEVFCKKQRYPLYCFGNTLGGSLRKWLREELRRDGHEEAAVEVFLSDCRFVGRDSRAGKKRLEFYCGVQMLDWDNDKEAAT